MHADVLRFDSTLDFNLCINRPLSSLKLNNQLFLFRGIDCMNMLQG